MGKRKRKLTPEEKKAKRERQEKFMYIFLNGKQKRVRRPPTIDGMDEVEFLARNADPFWLHEEGLWHLIPIEELSADVPPVQLDDEGQIPF